MQKCLAHIAQGSIVRKLRSSHTHCTQLVRAACLHIHAGIVDERVRLSVTHARWCSVVPLSIDMQTSKCRLVLLRADLRSGHLSVGINSFPIDEVAVLHCPQRSGGHVMLKRVRIECKCRHVSWLSLLTCVQAEFHHDNNGVK